MTTLFRMVDHLSPALSRFAFGAPDQDYRGPLCSEEEDRLVNRLGLALLGALPAVGLLTLSFLEWYWA